MKATICIFAILAMCAIAAQPDWETERVAVSELRQILATNTLENFAVLSEGHPAPWIHSECWVRERMPKTPMDRVRLEEEKRFFGYELAVKMEKLYDALVRPATTPEWERLADALQRLSCWMETSRGYGNLVLSVELANMACIPIGHLIVDLSYPTNAINARIARIRSLEECRSFQLEVLNEESPDHFDAPRGRDEMEIETALLGEWSSRIGKAFSKIKHKFQYLPEGHTAVQSYPYEISFYFDDPFQEPFTDSHNWNRKNHLGYCITGHWSKIRAQILRLLMFRNVIGFFPEKPKKLHPEITYMTECDQAFEEAWLPYREALEIIGLAPSRVYCDLKENLFMDDAMFHYFQRKPEIKSPKSGTNAVEKLPSAKDAAP